MRRPPGPLESGSADRRWSENPAGRGWSPEVAFVSTRRQASLREEIGPGSGLVGKGIQHDSTETGEVQSTHGQAEPTNEGLVCQLVPDDPLPERINPEQYAHWLEGCCGSV